MNEPDLQPPPPVPGPPPPRAAAPAPDANALGDVLGRVRERAALVAFARTALLGLAAAFALLALAVVLLALKQEWARTAGWLAALIAFAGALARGVLLGRRAARDEVGAARALGRVAPLHASDLVSAVELTKDPSAGAPAFVRAHLARMGAVSTGLDLRGVVPLRPLAIGAGALLGALLVHVALSKAGGKRFADAYAYLSFDAAAEAAPLFAPEPIAGDVTLTYRYPVHMNRAPRTVAGTAGDIAAPKGTIVEISARADRDIARAFAVVGKDAIPLRVSGREVVGELLVGGPGDWRFRWAKESGSTVAEGPPRPITVEPDAFPDVKLTAPAQELEVEGREGVKLAFNAGDDFGLSKIELVWSFGKGSEEQRKEVASLKDVPRRFRGEYTWDLSPLKLDPGDRVTYRLEAFDNDGVAGLKKGVSQTQVLKVFSETEHHAEVLKKASEQWERLVLGLGDRIEEKPAGDKGELVDEAWAKATEAKDTLMTSVSGDMRRLARELAEDKRAPPEIGRALAAVGSRVGAAVQKTAASRRVLVQRPSLPGARSFRSVLAAEVREDEQGVLYLEDLLDRRRLLDLAQLARELQSGRKELSRLVEEFKKNPDDAKKRELLGEVARLKERLHQLFKRMQELQSEIQDEHLNAEADRTLDEGRDMLGELDEIQKALSKGDSEEALKALDKLQKELEAMEKKFNEGAGEVDEEAQQIGRELQQLASDLMDVEAEQQALRQKTEAMRAREKEEQRKRLEKLGQEFIEKQRERAKAASAELDRVDRDVAENVGEDDNLQAGHDRLSQLDQALEAGDFDEAQEQSEAALRHAQNMRLRLDMERNAARQFPAFARDPAGLDSAQGHVEKAEKSTREVNDDLKKLMRAAQQQPTPEERRQMQDLAKRQDGLEKQAQQLQKKLDEIGQKMPLFGPGQGKLLDEAAQKMGEAEGRLGEGNPRGASSRQGDALQKLKALRDAMRESGNQGEGSGGVPMPFGPSPGENGDGEGQGFRAERVEIPAADQSRAPEEFRKDILDAMKDEAPDRYREKVREYYEELVK